MSGIERVLIVSSSESGQQFIAELLSPKDYSPVITAACGAEARRLLADSDYDMVIINAPLTDEYGHEFACLAARQSMAGVMMLVKNERVDDVETRVEADGVFVIPKPISRPFFFQSLKLVRVSRRYMMGLQKENRKLQTAIDDIRLINRAKCALIQCLLMTEPQAHRYLEKQAMDLRLSKREVAESILKTYEL